MSGSAVSIRVRQIIDRWVPADLDRDDEDLLLRARLVVGSFLCILFYFPFFGILGLLLDGWLTGSCILLGWLPILATPYVLRHVGPSAAGHLFSGVLLVTVTAVAVVNGGAESHLQLALSMIPVFAVATTGLRGGLAWTCLAVLAGLGLFAGTELGVDFPRDLAPAWMRLLQTLVFPAVLTVVLTVMGVHEWMRAAAQEVVRERESEVQAIVESAPDALVVVNSAGSIDRVNPAGASLFGEASEALAGRPVSSLFEEGLPAGSVAAHEARGVAVGRRFPAVVSAVALGFGDLKLVTVRDVTAAQEVARATAEARDRALEANAAKSAFLANMSHELRTPLNAILGYGEMIAEELDDDGLSEDMERVLSAGRHLLQLIDDLLDLSKIEAGRLSIDLQPVDIRGLVEDVVSTVQPSADARQNRLQSTVQAEIGTMTTDGARVTQVLTHLLANAVKFTEQGAITLEVTRHSGADGTFVRFRLSDEGIGMSPAEVDRIFGEFVQADSSSTRRFGGSGLGLSITRHLLGLLRGSIHVHSMKGEGSTFTVEIPA